MAQVQCHRMRLRDIVRSSSDVVAVVLVVVDWTSQRTKIAPKIEARRKVVGTHKQLELPQAIFQAHCGVKERNRAEQGAAPV